MSLAEAVAKRTIDLLIKTGKSQYRLIKETCLDKTTIQALLKNKTLFQEKSLILTLFLPFDKTNVIVYND